jgi:hypothetical protein
MESTIAFSVASFVIGAVLGVVASILSLGKYFVSRNECGVMRDNCRHNGDMERASIDHIRVDIKELKKWLRLMAGKLNLELPDND